MINGKKLLLDLGMQPIANRYLSHPSDDENLFSMKLGQCEKTGLIQLIDPIPHKELVPKYDWITYMEPEDHLDQMVDEIQQFLLKDNVSKVGGVSFKDDTTLERFEKLGHQTWSINLEEDLFIDSYLGIESIQAVLNKDSSNRLLKRYGKSNLIIARHIYEHVYKLEEFLECLKNLIYDDGFILFEIPDCTTSLENYDYTMTWEEHIIYLTPETFKYLLSLHGFSVVLFKVYPYPHESSIVALVKKNNQGDEALLPFDLDKEIKLGQHYADNFNNLKNHITNFINEKKKDGEIVLFGAGQDTCAFLNYFNLSGQIDYVVDDNINKNGLFMPKSRIPIVASEIFDNKNISLCLLSLNPINEDKVFNKLKEYNYLAGRVFSIFPHSKYSFLKH